VRQASYSPESIATIRERELRLVREAVAMVASGGAPRVVLAGLRAGAELLGPARSIAAEAGVRVVRLPVADSHGADIAVERIDG
jgi:hypothetical protein